MKVRSGAPNATGVLITTRFVNRAAVLATAAMLCVGVNVAAAGSAAAVSDRTVAVRAVAVGAPTGGTVYSVHDSASGSRVETTYDPAPGVSAARLAASLRAKGVAAARATEPVATKAVCSYGTARTWGCPMARWGGAGGSRAVYFIDHTSSAWPVPAVASAWNRTLGLAVRDRWYGVGCPRGPVHCVNVFDGDFGATGWTGKTTRTVNRWNYITSATTRFNDHYRGTAAQHRNTACHETGHVLGLDHNRSPTSCMYARRTSAQLPNHNDFSLLENYY